MVEMIATYPLHDGGEIREFKRGGTDAAPMTNVEKQFYDLLIEIKEDQAALSAMVKADRWVHEEHMRRIVTLEERVAANTKQVTALSSALRAWYIASAAVGGIAGWVLSHFPWRNG